MGLTIHYSFESDSPSRSDAQRIVEQLHRAACDLPFAEVKDEGGFWEHRDVAKLIQTIGQWNRHLAGFVGQVKTGSATISWRRSPTTRTSNTSKPTTTANSRPVPTRPTRSPVSGRVSFPGHTFQSPFPSRRGPTSRPCWQFALTVHLLDSTM